MARPPLPLGTYRKIKIWQEGGNGQPLREVGRMEMTSQRKSKSLTADEHQQWLNALDVGEGLRAGAGLMLATGCRIGECLAIGWG